ncbi:hypothetical protein [Carnobacterium sp.]|uniref:hypothetical protein n=1 Tax=Carnobacterium sp. TaxID=48221 RepID=UPI0038910F51
MKLKLLNIIFNIILGFILCFVGINIRNTITVEDKFNFYTSLLTIIIVVIGGINISEYMNKKTMYFKNESLFSTLPLIIGLLIAGACLKLTNFI